MPRVSFAGRNAWKVFTVLGVIVVLFGAGDIASGGTSLQSGEAVLFRSMTGTTWDELRAANPGAAKLIDYLWRAEGAALILVGLLTVAISLTALRRGDRWAWYAMWVFPLWIALVYLVFWRNGSRRYPDAPIMAASALWHEYGKGGRGARRRAAMCFAGNVHR